MPLILNGTTGISGVDGSAGTPSYVGVDTDTGVLFPAANTLALSTGGTERVRVNSSGNVGIGTNNPVLGLLDINGASATLAVRTSDTTSPTLALFVNAGSNGVGTISVDNGGVMTFDTGSTGAGQAERMRIDSSGNVGIGTSSPSVRLDVNGGRSYFAANNEPYSIGVRYNGSTNGAYIGSPSADTLTISSWGGTERMRIDSSGRLLVGTTSATFTYTGAGQTATAQQVISTSGYDCINLISTGANPGIDFSQPNSASTIYRFANITGVMTTSTAGSESGALIFATGNAGANSAERMRIDASGRVTMPSQPTFFARGSANLSPASGTSKVTGLSTADINIGSSYNTSTSTFTTPVAGTYQITLIATWNTSGSSQYIGAVLYKNGGNAFSTYSSKPSSGYAQTVLTVNITLSAGDTLEFYIDTQAGGCELERGRTYFMGRLLG